MGRKKKKGQRVLGFHLFFGGGEGNEWKGWKNSEVRGQNLEIWHGQSWESSRLRYQFFLGKSSQKRDLPIYLQQFCNFMQFSKVFLHDRLFWVSTWSKFRWNLNPKRATKKNGSKWIKDDLHPRSLFKIADVQSSLGLVRHENCSIFGTPFIATRRHAQDFKLFSWMACQLPTSNNRLVITRNTVEAKHRKVNSESIQDDEKAHVL